MTSTRRTSGDLGAPASDIDNLDYSFLEQSEIQISRLKLELLKDEEPMELDEHRLYKFNPFEDLDNDLKQELDQKLIKLLESLGSHLYDEKRISVVDRKNYHNYCYTKQGVIRLKPREDITLSMCKQKKHALLLHIVAKSLTLLQNNSFMSLRELYYRSTEICQQRVQKLNICLDDLCCLLGCSKVHLRILNQPKGIVYGDMKIKLKNGEVLDFLANREGTTLPTAMVPIVSVESHAKFLLILEKDSVLQRIISQEAATGFIKKYKVVLFTAKGYPDMCSRAFLNFLWSKLKIPMFALTDADPHGLEIVCCYKFGCFSAASESQYLALPHLRWLGLLPSDVEKHMLPDHSTIRQSVDDLQKMKSLYQRPYLKAKPDWIHQLNILRDLRRKAELEAIDVSGEYLVRTYLPNKLRYASWL